MNNLSICVVMQCFLIFVVLLQGFAKVLHFNEVNCFKLVFIEVISIELVILRQLEDKILDIVFTETLLCYFVFEMLMHA